MPKNAKPLVTRGGDVVCPNTMSPVSTKTCESCRKYQDYGRTNPDPKTKESYRTVLCELFYDLSDKEIAEYKEKEKSFFKEKDAEKAEREAKVGTREATQERYTHPHYRDEGNPDN